MYVYVFFYNPCIYESDPMIISVHLTLQGAYRAMMSHKIAAYYLYMSRPRRLRFYDKFNDHVAWELRRFFVYEDKEILCV